MPTRSAAGLDRWLEHPKAIVLWAIALLLAGLWTARSLPLEWVPSVELPRVSISASWPGASPQAVERFVTAPIERALQGISGTTALESLSRPGQAFVRLELTETSHLGRRLAEVSDRLAMLRATLPAGVVPHLDHEVPEELREEQGFMTLQLVGALTPSALRRSAETVVVPRLASLHGIAGVVVEGGEAREILITMAPDRLAAHSLTDADLRQRVGEALPGTTYGTLHGHGRTSLLVGAGVAQTETLRHLPITADAATGHLVRLGDVARVALAPAPQSTISRIDGKPVVSLILDRAPGSHLLQLARAVADTIDALQPQLPAGMDILIADDRSEQVRDQLRDLALRGGGGLLLILATLVLMLRSPRAAAVVVFSVAVALAVAPLLMPPLGLTLNLLTLAGLVLVTGLLVDNGVVVVEQLIAHCEHSPEAPRAQIAREALRQVSLPLLAGTLTTVVVLSPLVYLSGELRALFAPFGLLVALTLAASLLSALFLVPVLSRFLPRMRVRRSPVRRLRRRLLALPYRAVARHPFATLVLLLLAFGLPTSVLPTHLEEPDEGWPSAHRQQVAERYNRTLGSDTVRSLRARFAPLIGGAINPFLEDVELGERWDFDQRPELYVYLNLPAGSGIARADELILDFERQALASPVTRRTFTRVNEDRAFLRVLVDDAALDTPEPYALRQRLIHQGMQLAGMQVAVNGLVPLGYNSGLGNVSGFTIEAYGPSYQGLEEVATAFAHRLRKDPRVAAVDIHAGRQGQAPPREVVRLGWGPEATARTGLTTDGLAALLRARLLPRQADLFADLADAPRTPIRFVMAQAEAEELDTLMATPLVRDGGALTLGAGMATLAIEKQPAAIERFNQQYKRNLRVHYRGPHRMGRELIERELAAAVLPPGYRLEHRTYTFFSSAVKKTFLWLLLAAAGLIFLVLAAVLESWRLPWVVMLSVPLSFVGVALGFLWTGANFAEGAFIGLVLLFGIAVNDSILLVGCYRQLRAARPHTMTSTLIRLAVRNRLRPMWTTTLTSVAGLLPLLLFPGQDDFWLGLAVTVVGGLLSSTLLAPLATVALLSRTPLPQPAAVTLPWRSPVEIAAAPT